MILNLSEYARTSDQMADIIRKRLEDKKVFVPYDESFANWLRGLGEVVDSRTEIKTSLQKFYIYRHPSQTGWLSRLGFKEYTDSIPRSLHLIEGAYSVSDMGLVLNRVLASSHEREALDTPADVNPLVLGLGEQIFFLYSLLQADGDFLLPFVNALFVKYGSKRFDFVEAGSLVPNVLAEMRYRFSGSAHSQADRAELRKIDEVKNIIQYEQEHKKHKEGSGSRREQTTIPRLEWLVDLDLLERAQSGTRCWRFTKTGSKINELTRLYTSEMKKSYPEKVIGHILDSSFFSLMSRIYSKRKYSEIDKERFLIHIWPFYTKLVGKGRYCLLRPLLLAANASKINNADGPVLEYEKALDLLEQVFRSNPELIHYTINRNNTDKQLKIYRNLNSDSF